LNEMKYNLKIAFRNLQRNGLYSWINVLGLAVSLTAVIFIALWVDDELSYDRFHRKADNIYHMKYVLNRSFFIGHMYWDIMPVPMAPFIEENFPEVAGTCRAEKRDNGPLEYDGTKYPSQAGLAVDAQFFTLFDFPLLAGDPHHPFPDDEAIILSETKAKVIFGDKNPLGEMIKLGEFSYHVTGVVQDAPHNSSLQFDYLIPLNAIQKTYGGNGKWTSIHDDWGWYRCATYLLLRNGEDAQALAGKISQHVTRIRNQERLADGEDEDEDEDEDDDYTYILQPLLKTRLYRADGEPEGMKTVYLLSLIMSLILLIACINYVNLVTARASKRSKEMAVRKIMGGTKTALFLQLMRETLVLLVLALVIASFLIVLLLPLYNELSGKAFLFVFNNPAVWKIYGIMAVSVLVLAGLYPAFLLSAFQPMDAFRSTPTGKGKGNVLRKILVALQFAVSFGLIVMTIGIARQIYFMRTKDLGYDKENVLVTSGGDNIRQHADAIRNELLQNEAITDVTISSCYDMLAGTRRGGCDWPGRPNDLDPLFDEIRVIENFCDFMHIPLLLGEPFSPLDSMAILLNEEAVRIMGVDNPIGMPFYLNKGDKRHYTVKGVVRDFHAQPLHEPIAPLIIIRNDTKWLSAFFVKTTGTNTQSAIAGVEKIWQQYQPEHAFEYHFLDETFAQRYKTEMRMGWLLVLFTVVAVFISCIGLLGMVTYVAEAKTKEIGVRKVMGASVRGIVRMLLRDFLLLAGIGIVVALPVTYYYLHMLLRAYAYRIPLSWQLFAAGAGVLLLLTALSVGFKAFRSATANPVKAIKCD
jgi:ABC-type antimicrobial peptide transport system permease subunit